MLRPRWLALALCLTLLGCPPSRRDDDDDDDDSSDVDGGGDGDRDAAPSPEGACDGLGFSYEGCEYWAVDLPNYPILLDGMSITPSDAQYAVVVSNGDPTHEAEVVVYAAGDREVDRAVVAPTSTHVFDLGPANIEETGVTDRAFRISASHPVTAYQFNPLNNTEEAFSNDASLLLPVNALGDDYVVVTADAAAGYDDLGEAVNLGAFVVVVGISDDPVHVTVTPTADVVPGGGLGAGRTPIEVDLGKYEVLAVESRGSEELTPGNGNLSGSRVQADGPVAVFAATECSFAPLGDGASCCCDHTEEQMFPLATLGQSFVGAPSADRGGTPIDVWRLTAGEDDVSLTWVDRPAGAPDALDAFESVEFTASDAFAVTGSGRLQLMQTLVSSQQVLETCVDDFDCGDGFSALCGGGRCITMCDPAQNGADCPVLATCLEDPFFPGFGQCEPVGDPATILVPPVEQFRSDYVFLTPDDYAHDYVTVIAPEGTTVEIDGREISGFREIGEVGGTTYTYATYEIPGDGTHIVHASAPVALLVFGYDQDVSYGYPAGLDLEELLI